jgi:hypothetical protein
MSYGKQTPRPLVGTDLEQVQARAFPALPFHNGHLRPPPRVRQLKAERKSMQQGRHLVQQVGMANHGGVGITVLVGHPFAARAMKKPVKA